MNYYHYILRGMRRMYARTLRPSLPPLARVYDPDEASDIIHGLIAGGKPCMIARFGAVEIGAIVNYLGIISGKRNPLKMIMGKQPEWWWNENMPDQMQRWSGFFPPTPENLSRFCELMLHDAGEVDVLGSWLESEHWMADYVSQARKVRLLLLEPFWAKEPWTRALRGKRVLVVHPFKETILRQYDSPNRSKLFSNPDVLPEFGSLRVVKAVQSIGGDSHGFADWFEALEWMEREMDSEPYDVALIGCGAYGFPLAAHAKRTGHQAVHIGGSLQLLFGIKGKRWENPMYGADMWQYGAGNYPSLINDYFLRPNETDTPEDAKTVEDGCYW